MDSRGCGFKIRGSRLGHSGHRRAGLGQSSSWHKGRNGARMACLHSSVIR